MPYGQIAAWRGFSATKQSDIATAATVNVGVSFMGDLASIEADKWYANSDQVTGTLNPTQARLITKKLQFKHKSHLKPAEVGLFASMVMQTDTVTTLTGAARRHRIVGSPAASHELPYRTMVEHDGRAAKRYTGIAASGFKLSGKRGDLCSLEVDLIGATLEADSAITKPAEPSEPYLSFCDVTIIRGGTFDGSAFSGGTALSAKLDSFELECKNNAVAKVLMGDPSCGPGEIRRGPRFTTTLKLVFDTEDASHQDALVAGTEYLIAIPIIGKLITEPDRYMVRPVTPKAVYKQAKKKHDSEGTLQHECEFEVLDDGTYQGLVLDVVNTHAASYLA